MRLADVLRPVRALLLDFDGPVCAVFAGYPAPAVADQLRQVATANGATVPPEAAHEGDPLRVLRLVAEHAPADVVRTVADALRTAEVTAVSTAAPTAGAHDVLDAAHARGLPVAIVSNNSVQAVHSYLNRTGLASLVEHVSARYDGMDPRLLKPHDHLVHRAIEALGVPPDRVVFVGDSLSDLHAGRTAGVPVIGYANKPGKAETLAVAVPEVMVATMAELAQALRGATQGD